jgi:hypothetical protein
MSLFYMNVAAYVERHGICNLIGARFVGVPGQAL